MKNLLLLLLIILSNFLHAEFINIGVLVSKSINQIEFNARAGKYAIFTEKGKLKEIDLKATIEIKAVGELIEIRNNGRFLGKFKKVNLIGVGWYNHFKISSSTNSKIDRRFDDNLKITNHRSKLKLVNNINLDNYVSGVVEAEVGRKPAKEYFKLQAIICRTYALSNTQKHLIEGYNLCDEVHCQAYHGKSFFPNIVDAAMQTKGAVIVDSDIQLITAAFHSNCGGQTVNSEDVWSKSLYYLRSVKDTFCLNKPNSHWEKEIDNNQWKNYLLAKLPQTSDSVIFKYKNPERLVFYPSSSNDLSFEDLRYKFKLRSTFFDVSAGETMVLLKGRGYGHGVGLCQIGAMEMALQGYNYSEILHFYYNGLHLIDLSEIDFFKED
jgi:stage II sporulation protein D